MARGQSTPSRPLPTAATLGHTWVMALHGYMGLALWLGVATASLAGVGWARTWFYEIAWWGYILALDGWLKQKTGASPLMRDSWGFLALSFVSVAWWLFWELVNLRLGNWHYEGVSPEAWQRYTGAFVAFATVLPGVLLTDQALAQWPGWARMRARPLPQGRAWHPWFFAIGALLFLLPLLWPRLFFPTIWVAAIFILEPINHRLGAPSLMADLQRGAPGRVFRLLAAGMVCGGLWESWNFLSGAQWAYTLPYLNQPRLFAMPVAGYLGFAPFALECFAAASLACALMGGRGWPEPGAAFPHLGLSRPLRWALALALLVFDLWVLGLMEAQGVYWSFAE